MRLLVGHDELEMDPKELPAEQLVTLGLDDFTEPDRHDRGVASGGAGIDAVAGDRIGRKEAHPIPAAGGARIPRSRSCPRADKADMSRFRCISARCRGPRGTAPPPRRY